MIPLFFWFFWAVLSISDSAKNDGYDEHNAKAALKPQQSRN